MNNLKMKNFRVIGFDADDTLWVNEPYYQETEKKFCDLLSEYMPAEEISRELLLVEKLNLELYGYGTKAFMLSMIETALRITNCNVSSSVISSVILLGKQQLDKPVVLLDGIEETLVRLTKNGIKIILASKGDLLDQERKLAKSNIAKYFHHIEIMSEKK
ncbi:MAG: HAD family hydrolase, partial [Bacteroidota bacterium]